MNIYYERVNQRYRGPFEQEKLAFLFNQIKKNIAALYKACEDQRIQITDLSKLNETQGFDFQFEPEINDDYDKFESDFRNNFEVASRVSISQKEKLRDLAAEVETFISSTNETF